MDKIKLSVLVPSYNKKSYIGEALNSILRQKTNFDFNIIITDDGSTDGTLDIVNQYIKEFPEKIVLLPSAKNQGLLSNIIKAYEYMNSEYFCCLDPDDYYVDDLFYQKAIDFLDNNTGFNIYASRTSYSIENGKIIEGDSEFKEFIYDSTFMDMLNKKIPLGNTISSIFRNNVINKKLIENLKKYIGNSYSEHAFREDDFRNRIHLHKGMVHYVNEIVGVYRYTDSGLYRSSNMLKKMNMKISAYIYMYHFFEHKYPQFMRMALEAIQNIHNNVIKGDLNNLLIYPEEDIIQMFSDLQEIQKFDSSFYSTLITELKQNKKEYSLKTKRKWFAINHFPRHLVIVFCGIKIKIKH